MKQYTTWTAPCGCQITYRWDDEDDPKHRRHTFVDDLEHAQARLERSGRGFPEHAMRKGCDTHAHEDHHIHGRHLKRHWHKQDTLENPEAMAEYRMEWHEDGWTLHHEPKGG